MVNVQIAKDGKSTLVFTFENVSDEQMSNLIENAVLEAVKAQTGDENATIEEYFADFFTAAQNSGNPGKYFSDNSGYFGNDKIKYLKENINVVKLTSDTGKEFGDFKDTYSKANNGNSSDNAKAPHPYDDSTAWIIAGDGTSYGASEFVSIGVVSNQQQTDPEGTDDDVVVGVWYDSEERELKYSYNTNPKRLRSSEGAVANEAEWQTPITVFQGDMENAGEYCQLVVDAKGGIHIAAYDGSNTDVVYAYLSSYNASPVTCVVDSAGVVGSNLTIDVALDSEGENAIPRISYYSNSCVKPKLAYLVNTESANPDGAVDEEFTGKWEITVVPTPKTLNMQSALYNKINIAVWKNDSGAIKNSVEKPAGTPDNKNELNSFQSDSYGFVYGNGTSNAVLGYAVKEGAGSTIETAQMK